MRSQQQIKEISKNTDIHDSGTAIISSKYTISRKQLNDEIL